MLRRLAPLAAVVLSAALLAGCSTADDEPDRPSPSSTPSATAPAPTPTLSAAPAVPSTSTVASVTGRSVEVRVPPYAAAQVVPGVRHTRGTPPAVVELDAETWIALATGELGWSEAVADGRIRASGERADLSPYLPLTL